MKSGIYRACLVGGELIPQGSTCPRHPPRSRWASTAGIPASARGYGHEHRQLRETLLKKHPICQCTGWCGRHSGPCGNPSTIRDHILNKARGGTDAPDNEQALCKDCHDIKTRREGRIQRRQPQDSGERRPGGMILVAGPPCGGKTTWAREHGTSVLDFDDLVEAQGVDRYSSDSQALAQAHQAWIAGLRTADVVVWTAPRRVDRGRFRTQYGAQVVVVMASMQECLRRAEQERPEAWVRAIYGWFQAWQPSRSGQERIVVTG